MKFRKYIFSEASELLISENNLIKLWNKKYISRPLLQCFFFPVWLLYVQKSSVTVNIASISCFFKSFKNMFFENFRVHVTQPHRSTTDISLYAFFLKCCNIYERREDIFKTISFRSVLAFNLNLSSNIGPL